MKAVQPVITSNGVPYLQMRLIGSHSMSGMEKVGELDGIKLLSQEGSVFTRYFKREILSCPDT
jgi:hypothetical protein